MDLVIVESPTKARKLGQYLGKAYSVKSSVGHVRDLPKKKLGVDEKTFEPEYEISVDKEKVVAELKHLAKKAKAIYLAMDPDREGEAIAWHLKYILSHDKSAKKEHKFLRSTFHEITKEAVMSAIAQPGKLNQNLVDAQQARRVLDRLVGYKVSPVLWKKVRRGLSAGRVQSPALRLIVEKEREIEAFKPQEYWEVDVLLDIKKSKDANNRVSTNSPDEKPNWLDESPADTLVARVVEVAGKKYEPNKEGQITGVVEWLPEANYQIEQVEKKERRRASLPPFTTSTLQQAAANRLGMTSKQTMRLAQQLYEEGLITYHRTDSVNLSDQAIKMARDYVQKEFGAEYLPSIPRVFKKQSKNAQEAHEAVRVTDVTLTNDKFQSPNSKIGSRHQQLYDLIWRRFVASQMEMAVYDQTTVLIAAKKKTQNAKLKSTGSVLRFAGWMKLFPNAGDRILPAVTENQELFYQDLFAAQKFTQAPARFNDASLVKELEHLGIGRPSTYASIISVIVDRGYVERVDRRFKPTPVGMTVSDFLMKNITDIMDYDFTAQMEDDLDEIAAGKKEWKKIVGDFYQPFEKKLAKVTDDAKRVEIPVEKTGKKCPECGKIEKGEVVIRSGRFGKFYSCSRFPECKYTENIVNKLEGQHCPLCSKGDIIIKNTRWGKPFYGCSTYPDCDWASWAKPEKDLKLSKTEWKKMQAEREAKKEQRAKAKKSKK